VQVLFAFLLTLPLIGGLWFAYPLAHAARDGRRRP